MEAVDVDICIGRDLLVVVLTGVVQEQLDTLKEVTMLTSIVHTLLQVVEAVLDIIHHV